MNFNYLYIFHVFLTFSNLQKFILFQLNFIKLFNNIRNFSAIFAKHDLKELLKLCPKIKKN
jgi:hypothetical protein